MTFASMQLAAPLLRAIQEQGYDTPTPIQTKAIPVVLQGNDLLASAQTGTGKTAGFVLPILHRLAQSARATPNHALVLVLAPTRELAAQVQESVIQYGKYLSLRSAVVFGGVKINPQMMKLRAGIEILVATPGRLLDLHRQNAIQFDRIEVLVLDEADTMLDMGFIHDIKRIISLLPRKRQNLLFSATFSEGIRKLAKEFLTDPVEIDVAPRNAATIQVSQVVHPVDKGRKTELLSHLVREKNWHQVLVFARTKHGANRLVKLLTQDDIQAVAIHGNKSQAQRTKALSDFKTGKIQLLVATDIAARGLDIEQLPLVVNFDLPQIAENYVHRIGRTGRAGAFGQAISLVCADEFRQLQAIEKLIKQSIERVALDDFEPSHSLPASGNSTNSANRNKNQKSRNWQSREKVTATNKPNSGFKRGTPSRGKSSKPRSSMR